MATMHRLSREFVWWKVTSAQDLSAATAEVALVEAATIPTVEWVAAGLTLDGNGDWWVTVLVSGTGNGGDIALDPGDYQSWVRITDATEAPVRRPGTVTIE